jgi:hypothetical protein
MSQPRPWIKVWERWLTTPSHEDLDGEVLWHGLGILLVANRGEEDDAGCRWLRTPKGEPMSLPQLAKKLRMPLRRLDRIVQEFCAVGTFVVRDGVVGVPKYKRWQESDSARRTREWREKKESNERHGDRHGDVTDKRTVTSPIETETEIDPPKPPAKRGVRRRQDWPVTETEREQIGRILGEFVEIKRTEHGESEDWSVCKSNGQQLLKRLRDNVLPERLADGFRARSWKAKQDPDELQWLNPVTPFRDDRWPRTEALIAVWKRATQAPTKPRNNPDRVEI